jgi:O-antigen/teichoic acid export membrane protein
MKSIKNLFIYLVPSLVSAIIPIITLPIFTRILTVEDYGIYALGLVYGTFVSGIANFGLTIGYERNFFENNETKEKQAALLFSVLLFVVSAFILFGVITFFFKSELAIWIIGDVKWGDIILLSYCAVGISSLKIYYLTYFKNTNNAKLYAWYSIDETILNVAFSFVLIYFFDSGVTGLVLGQLIGSSIIFLILTFKFFRSFSFQPNLSLLKSCLNISLPLTPRIFFGVIGNQFDKYMINLLGSVGGVGVYNLGQKISYVVFNFMTAIQNVNSPHVYDLMFKKGEVGGQEIGKYLTLPLYISAFIGLSVSLFSEEIILTLTPSSFHRAIDITTVLSLLYVTYFFGKQPQLIYAKKTAITSYLTIFSIVLNILINIIFIKHWGAEGAAYGTLLAGILSSLVTFYYSQKYFNIVWEYEKIAYIFLSLFVFAFIIIFLRKLEVVYYNRLIVKLLFVAFYLLLGFNFNIINKEMFYKLKLQISK